MNQTIVVGNLTSNTELRFTPSGGAVVNFTVAVNYKQNGEDKTDFFNCVAFGDQAENLAELEKGTRVIVAGKNEIQQWKDKEGHTRSKHQIVANEVGVSVRWAKVDVTKNPRKQAEQPEAF